MKKFNVNIEKINLKDLIFVDEQEVISPYQQSREVEIILFRSLNTKNVFSETLFKDENGKKNKLKEKRDVNIFNIYNKNENCGKLNRKIFKEKNSDFFIVIYSKDEMSELCVCMVEDKKLDLVKEKEWIGIELTNMNNIFSEKSLINSSFEFLPRMLCEKNISDILDFLSIENKKQNVIAIKSILDKAERERERKYGDNYGQNLLSKDEFFEIFGKDIGLPFELYQVLECFFNEEMIDFSLENGLGEYYKNVIQKLEKAKKMMNFMNKH